MIQILFLIIFLYDAIIYDGVASDKSLKQARQTGLGSRLSCPGNGIVLSMHLVQNTSPQRQQCV